MRGVVALCGDHSFVMEKLVKRALASSSHISTGLLSSTAVLRNQPRNLSDSKLVAEKPWSLLRKRKRAMAPFASIFFSVAEFTSWKTTQNTQLWAQSWRKLMGQACCHSYPQINIEMTRVTTNNLKGKRRNRRNTSILIKQPQTIQT